MISLSYKTLKLWANLHLSQVWRSVWNLLGYISCRLRGSWCILWYKRWLLSSAKMQVNETPDCLVLCSWPWYWVVAFLHFWYLLNCTFLEVLHTNKFRMLSSCHVTFFCVKLHVISMIWWWHSVFIYKLVKSQPRSLKSIHSHAQEYLLQIAGARIGEKFPQSK
jgi:hypothetical protein